MNLGFINVNFLIYGVFLGLYISVVINIISWNLDIFFDFFISILNWENNRSSINYFVFSVNELGLSSDNLVQNCWLFNEFLSNRKFELFIDDFWFSSNFFGQNSRRSSDSFFDIFGLFSDVSVFTINLILEKLFSPSSLINITVGIGSININAMTCTNQKNHGKIEIFHY